MAEKPKLITNSYRTLTHGDFTHTFTKPGLLMNAMTVPIAYLPSNIQGRPSTYQDGKKLAFLGDSVLKTVMATKWAMRSHQEQDMLFFTKYFDNGIAKDSFLARIGDALQISHFLIAADGSRLTPEQWESPPVQNNQKKSKEKNKPVPSAVEALLGAIWMDCVLSGEKEPVATVEAFLDQLGLIWPGDEEQKRLLGGMIEAARVETEKKFGKD